VLAVTLGLTGLATTLAVSIVLDFDEGTAVGVLSGALTQSAALGTGLNAIAGLPIPEDLKAKLSGAAPLADAITYVFGDLGLILIITVIGPLLMRADLKAEAKALELKLSGGRPADTLLAGRFIGLRGYQVANSAISGLSVEEVEQKYADGRLSVQRLRRGSALLDVTPDARIQLGDRLVVAAQRATLARAEQEIGPEIDDPDLLAVPLKSAAVVVTSRTAGGKTIAELAADRQVVRGIYLESIKRGEEVLPRQMGTVVERGDVIRIVGAPADVDRAASRLGFVERDLTKTDVTFLAAGISCGILLGLVVINFKGIPLGLGAAGSILVVGLIAGWARSRYPVFGSIPEAAQRVLADIGLIVFIAIIGLQAGPHALEAYQQRGSAFFASIFLGGMVVTVVPPLVTLLVARFALKMSPLMILAGLCGAQTVTPALNALREASGSNVATLGYTVPYAIGNILLTIWGPIVVAIIHFVRG